MNLFLISYSVPVTSLMKQCIANCEMLHIPYGEKQWNNKAECWKISRAFCDLTQETKDFMEPHFARVQALTTNGHSNWVFSERFIPFWETAIGPPKIKLSPQTKSILVKLLAPRTPFRRKNGFWITLEKIYSDIEYLVEIIGNPVDHRPELHTATSNTLNIQNLKPRTTYCMRARIKILFYSKIGEYGGKRCVTTSEDI
ncbi:interleukin-22 receptor subunit alpha-2-like [Heptranchias perlo]|uniref:interleukin-22 receptor subunit alpha-2-like n=1 Tax=Heptranchias perlo TaxID=212740 RepID=UPI00355A82F6